MSEETKRFPMPGFKIPQPAQTNSAHNSNSLNSQNPDDRRQSFLGARPNSRPNLQIGDPVQQQANQQPANQQQTQSTSPTSPSPVSQFQQANRAPSHSAPSSNDPHRPPLLVQGNLNRNSSPNKPRTIDISKPHDRDTLQLVSPRLKLGALEVLNEDIVNLCIAGNLDEFKKLLANHEGTKNVQMVINRPNKRGVTPLFCAARGGFAHMVIVLIAIDGVDVNQQMADGGVTSLHAAAANECSDVVAVLLQCGADRTILNAKGLTAKQEAKGKALTCFEKFECDPFQEFKKFYPITQTIIKTAQSPPPKPSTSSPTSPRKTFARETTSAGQPVDNSAKPNVLSQSAPSTIISPRGGPGQEDKKMLRIVVQSANMSKKAAKKAELKRRGTLTEASTKGYSITISVCDTKGNISGQEFVQTTKTIPAVKKLVEWNQSFLFPLPKALIGSIFINQLQFTVHKSSAQGKKEVGRFALPLAFLPAEGGIQEKRQNWGDDMSRILFYKIGWYGTSETSKKATEALIASKTRIYTDKDVGIISQKVLDLKKQWEQLTKELEQLQSSNEPCQNMLMKYASVDDEVKEVCGLAVASNIYAVEKSPSGWMDDKSDAKTCAESMGSEEALSYIAELKAVIGAADEKWKSTFIKNDGLSHLNTLLDIYLQRNERDHTSLGKEAQVASIIKSLMSDSALIDLVANNYSDALSVFIQTVIRSRNSLMRGQMFAFFSALCIFGSEMRNIIYQAFLDEDNLNSGQPMLILTQVIKNERDREVITSAMMLVNSLILGLTELGARIKLRHLFIQNGLVSILQNLQEKLPDEKALQLQIKEFQKSAIQDQEQFKKVKLFGTFDLTNINLVFHKIVEQTTQLKQEDVLLRHLQHLLLIPNVSDHPKEVWKYIDICSRRILKTTDYDILGPLSLQEIRDKYAELERQIQLGSQQKSMQKWKIHIKTPKSSPKFPATEEQSEINVLLKGVLDVKQEDLMNEKSALDKGKDQGRSLDISIPEPKVPMRNFYWQVKKVMPNQPNSPSVEQYWKTIRLPMEELGNIFLEMEEIFFQPKAKKNVKEKLSLIPQPIANAINVWRAQFPHQKDEWIVEDLFDIQGSAGVIMTFHFEALLCCVMNKIDLLQLQDYYGDFNELSKADAFALRLLEIPNLEAKLENLIFWDEFQYRKRDCEVAIDRLISVCRMVMANSKLTTFIKGILTVSQYLNAPNPKKLSSISDPAILFSRVTVHLVNYLKGFVNTNYSELVKFKEELIMFEEACRFQPSLIEEDLEDLEYGLEQIAVETASIDDDGIYAQYYNSLEGFYTPACGDLQDLKARYEEWNQMTTKYLKDLNFLNATNCPSPPSQLWNIFYVFAKIFRDQYDSFTERTDERERRKRMEVRGKDEFGAIDKLIAAIREGYVGIDKESVRSS